MSKIAFMTLGCKVNQADTAGMQQLFRQAGYEIGEFSESADIYVVNTCVVTNAGQHKSRQMIRRAVRKNTAALVVVSGCYPQTAAEEVKAIEGVDLIVGTQDRSRMVELVEEALRRKAVSGDGSGDTANLHGGRDAGQNTARSLPRTSAVDDEVRPWSKGARFEEELAGGNELDKTRAYLKVQEGCNQYCSYCIIPYARGPLRSRSLQSIRAEVERLCRIGYQEVVLIGIHLGCYGKELADGTGLYHAVQAALSVPELQRLRLGSLESVEVEDRLLDLMAQDPRLCPHLHLPLQSGCNKVLREMNRPYTTETFTELLGKIRARVPNVAVTTDVITGFPGETEEEFAETMRFAERCGFAKMHIFPYSMRRGTPAAQRKDQVPEAVKRRRAERLAELDQRMQRAYLEQNVGRTVQVLVEQAAMAETAGHPFASHTQAIPSQEGKADFIPEREETGTAGENGQAGMNDLPRVEGLSENYIRLEFPGDPSLCGKIVTVKIEKAGIDMCSGRLL